VCQDHARLKHGHCHKLCSLEAKAAAAQTCSMGVCVAESVDAQSYPSPSLRTLNTDTRDHTARFPATKETSETLCSRDAACADAQLCRHITVVTGRLWHSKHLVSICDRGVVANTRGVETRWFCRSSSFLIPSFPSFLLRNDSSSRVRQHTTPVLYSSRADQCKPIAVVAFIQSNIGVTTYAWEQQTSGPLFRV
jgi:hypothetical protein